LHAGFSRAASDPAHPRNPNNPPKSFFVPRFSLVLAELGGNPRVAAHQGSRDPPDANEPRPHPRITHLPAAMVWHNL
jgi:hypothetical protein